MDDERRQDIQPLTAAADALDEEELCLLIRPAMDHLQDFRFDIVGAHGFQDIGQAFRDMDHTETAVIFQGILHGIEDVAEGRRLFMAGPADAVDITVGAAALFAVRRIGVDSGKGTARRPIADTAVIAFDEGDAVIPAVDGHVAAGNIGHDRIKFYGRQLLGAAGRQDEGDSRRSRPQVQGRAVGHGTEMGQEDRIQGKAELVIALDDLHAVQDQVVQPFVRA